MVKNVRGMMEQYDCMRNQFFLNQGLVYTVVEISPMKNFEHEWIIKRHGCRYADTTFVSGSSPKIKFLG